MISEKILIVLCIFAEMRQDDSLLNDRREYDVADLKNAYGLDDEQAQKLFELIQAEFSQ